MIVMADGTHLLRLLEPIFRPDGRGKDGLAPNEPIESRSFDALLQEASDMALDGPQDDDDGASPTGQSTEAGDVGLLKSLAQIERIENASLRQLVVRR